MKRILIVVIAFLTGLFAAFGSNIQVKDTLIRYNNKIIHIEDSIGKMKVEIRDSANQTMKPLYEGVFSDEKSFEKWTVVENLGIHLPFIKKMAKKKYTMEAHWAGIGWGFANFTNSSLALNNINGVSLRSEKSNEFYWNPIERIIPIVGNTVGITTGVGLNWRNYHLDNNTHFAENTGQVTAVSAPAGINYSFSRFRVFSFTIPLLIEVQIHTDSNKKAFLSAGVVGGVNTASSQRVKYMDVNNKKQNVVLYKDLNHTPLTLDYMAQIGYGAWSIYGKYAPFGLFQNQKGPKVQAVSLGATLNF